MDKHDLVGQMSKLALTSFGYLILPTEWFRLVRRRSGSVHLAATVILAEVVFWYRFRIVRDEKSGKLLRTECRFSGDSFRRSLTGWSDMLGLSRKEVRNAIETLKRLGLITVTIERMPGSARYREMGISPVVKAIEAITHPPVKGRARRGTMYARRGTIPNSIRMSNEREEVVSDFRRGKGLEAVGDIIGKVVGNA